MNKSVCSCCVIHETLPADDEPCWQCVNEATKPLEDQIQQLTAQLATVRDALEKALAGRDAPQSVLHIWYRLRNGQAVGIQVGGGVPNDAMRCVEEALNEGAVSLAITREDV